MGIWLHIIISDIISRTSHRCRRGVARACRKGGPYRASRHIGIGGGGGGGGGGLGGK